MEINSITQRKQRKQLAEFFCTQQMGKIKRLAFLYYTIWQKIKKDPFTNTNIILDMLPHNILNYPS